MKVIVTGAAGFIGSHMAEALARANHEVVGIDCVDDYYSVSQKELNIEDLKKSGVHFIKKDLSVDDLKSELDETEVIFHFAAQPGISSQVPFEKYEKNNFYSTFRLLEEAGRVPSLKLFVYISTSSVYGAFATGNEESHPKPTSFYGVTKLAGEQLAMSYFHSYKLPVTSFRLYSVYGERERSEKFYPKLIASILENREIGLYDGSQNHIRSYTYVGDVVKGLMSSLENISSCIGEIFNMGSENAITTGEGIKIVEDIIGKKANIKILPKRVGDQSETHADITKIKKILNFSPQTSAEEGLKKEVEWVKKVLSSGVKL